MEKKITLWAARLSKDGSLDLFIDKPRKDEHWNCWAEGEMFGMFMPHFFPEVASENSPVEVELTIKVKE